MRAIIKATFALQWLLLSTTLVYIKLTIWPTAPITSKKILRLVNSETEGPEYLNVGNNHTIKLNNDQKTIKLKTEGSRESVDNPITWLDEYYCEVHCEVATPCEYKDEVDFRVIVMTMNRPESLNKTLAHVGSLKVKDEVKISVDIWIDRSTDGVIDALTLQVAATFKASWSGGRVCVHKRDQNAHILGQWIDTWKPKANTAEIALILEDDIDISPFTYSWLYAVHKEYGYRDDIAGYTLQMEHIYWFAGLGDIMHGPENDTAFLYGVLGTWGFSPHPRSWREFQRWYHFTRESNIHFKPYVPNIVPTLWYKDAETRHQEHTMWEMWHIHYSYIKKQYTVYCNLFVKTQRKDVFLSLNRREMGLHYTESEKSFSKLFDTPGIKLLLFWDIQFVTFPSNIIKYSYNGTAMWN